VEYLSPAWLTEADRRLASLEASASAVTVAYTATAADADDVRYAIRLGPGPVSVRTAAEEIDAADVSFTLDRGLAEQIAAGARSASSAFLDGELRLGGDINVLLTEGARLAKVEDVLAGLRDLDPDGDG